MPCNLELDQAVLVSIWWEVLAVQDEKVSQAYGKPAALADHFSHARSA